MNIIKTDIPDIIQLRPKVFSDLRGNFRETYRESRYKEVGIDREFVQDNFVHSKL